MLHQAMEHCFGIADYIFPTENPPPPNRSESHDADYLDASSQTPSYSLARSKG
jgi:hypothetical protein